MRIGVIGAGRVGSGLGRMWARAGHEVMLSGSSDPTRVAPRAAEIGAAAGSAAEASAFGEVVVLATPSEALEAVLGSMGDLRGKVLVDCTNRLDPARGSLAEEVSHLAAGARVVKAFNTVFAALYSEVEAADGRPDMVFCGDDPDAKQLVATLIEEAGFRPVDAGGLSMAGDLEGFARVVIETARTQGHGPFVYRFMAPGELPAD